MMDYLTRPGGEFGSGDFAFSERGASHFGDCKDLFTLNTVAFIVSAALVIACLYLHKRRGFKYFSVAGFSPYALSGVLTLGFFSVLGALAAIDFDFAFDVFHRTIFRSNDYWLFDPSYDEIILAMPQEFFASCAALIAFSIIFLSAFSIVIGIRRTGRGKR